MHRARTITAKVSTKFGSHYCHVVFTGRRVTEISFSSPGKFADTALADMLTALAYAVNGVLADEVKRP